MRLIAEPAGYRGLLGNYWLAKVFLSVIRICVGDYNLRDDLLGNCCLVHDFSKFWKNHANASVDFELSWVEFRIEGRLIANPEIGSFEAICAKELNYNFLIRVRCFGNEVGGWKGFRTLVLEAKCGILHFVST